MLDRRAFMSGTIAATLAMSLAAEAQQAEKVPQIGVLRLVSPPDPFVEAFRQGLRDLGYVEGRTITLMLRWAEGKVERLPALAAEFVQLKVDVIVTAQTPPALAAKQATDVIPIVVAAAADPVGAGLVESLARPGRKYHRPDVDTPRATRQAPRTAQGNHASDLQDRVANSCRQSWA